MGKITLENKKQKNVVVIGFPVVGIAIILMVTGWAMNDAEMDFGYEGLGDLLFTIGFWLFMIPLIMIITIIVIFMLALALS